MSVWCHERTCAVGGNAPAENLGLRWLYNQNKRAAEEISGPPAQSWSRRRLVLGAVLLQLIGAGLMIAVLKRSGLDNRKRPQRFNRAGRNHAFVFSGSYNKLSRHLSIAS